MPTQKGSGWFTSLFSGKKTIKNNVNVSGGITGKMRSKLETQIENTLTDFFTIITDKRFVPNDYDHFYDAIGYAIRIGAKKHTNYIIKNYLVKKNRKMPTNLITEMTIFALNNKSQTYIKKYIHQYERYKNRQIKIFGLYHTKKAIPKMTYKLSKF